MADPDVTAQITAADADEFARLVAKPSRDEERALIDHLGEERLERMQRTVLRGGRHGTPEGARGNVIVLHGIMGSELSVLDGAVLGDRIWLHAARLAMGGVDRLGLAADGSSPTAGNRPVGASGILKRPYGQLLLSLSTDWNVRGFWFDWRKDLTSAADALRRRITAEFGEGPVHLVAHS